MTATLPNTELRDGALPDLVELLRSQADVKYDVVVPASRIRMQNGDLIVAGGAARITDEGVEDADATLVPTLVCEEGLCDKLGIPLRYYRSMTGVALRDTVTDLVRRGILGQGAVLAERDAPELLRDVTVNAWLEEAGPEHRFLVRGFRTDDPDQAGIARAFLSDRYAPIDNYDVLLAALAGVREAGVAIDIESANLTERNMRLSIRAPQIKALAPVLLANYRSPFGGGIERVRDLAAREGKAYEPGKEPVVHAGFEIRNSETGGGAFSIVPRLVIQICKNGLTIKADALREIHVGGRLDDGQIRWSDETQRKAVELVQAKVSDAVSTFLSTEFLERVIARVEEKAPTPVSDAAGTIERIQKQHGFSDREAASILDCFIKSGDLTAGGVMNAVTATAQTVEDADRASELEDVALDVLASAASR